MSEIALIPLLTAEVAADSVPACNARDLHAALRVGRDFSNWIKGRIEEYGFVANVDFLVIDSPNPANQFGRGFSPNPAKTSKGSKGGRPTIDYHLTLDMAKELAMIENNDIGRYVRRYFIRCEKMLRDELRKKAEHVLPVPGVKPMRDTVSAKMALMLHEQSRKVLRMIKAEPSKVERQNLHYHFRQINLVLGVPTIGLEQIEAEIDLSQPGKGA